MSHDEEEVEDGSGGILSLRMEEISGEDCELKEGGNANRQIVGPGEIDQVVLVQG